MIYESTAEWVAGQCSEQPGRSREWAV